MSTMKIDRAISAITLGPQWHIGNQPVAPLDWAHNVRNQRVRKPSGGFWTSSMDAHGHVPYMHYLSIRAARSVAGKLAWVLFPKGDDPVLRIDTEEDVYWLSKTFRTERHWLDAEAIRDAGYAGLNITNQAIACSIRYGEPLNWWHCESTVWFRWSFDELLMPFNSVHYQLIKITVPGLRLKDPLTLSYDPYWALKVSPAKLNAWYKGPDHALVAHGLSAPARLAAMIARWDVATPVDAPILRTALTRSDMAAIDYAIMQHIAGPTMRFRREDDRLMVST